MNNYGPEQGSVAVLQWTVHFAIFSEYNIHIVIMNDGLPDDGDEAVVVVRAAPLLSRFVYPSPVMLLGVQQNVMPITWLMCLNNRAQIMMSLNRRRYSAELLEKIPVEKRFVVLNVVTAEMVEQVLRAGKCSGREVADKYNEVGLERVTPGWRRVPNDDHLYDELVAVRQAAAHLVVRIDAMDNGDEQHWLLRCTIVRAYVKQIYWQDGKTLTPAPQGASPYLTFLGSQRFGQIVSL